VSGKTRLDILQTFEERLRNDRATEFAEALRQINRIAAIRLASLADKVANRQQRS